MRVAQITDTHLPADPADRSVVGWLCDVALHDPIATLSHVLRDIDGLEVRPDLLVATGDLADRGHRASYRRLNAMLDDLGIPTLVLPGNHDLADELDEALPGGCVELAELTELGGWTFAFARSGNTEWGELGGAQVERLSRALDRRANEPVLLWQHHPPIALAHGYLPDSGFLADDDAVLVERHDIRAIAVGHVHAQHDTTFMGAALHATPSTFLGAPGPGYRLFDFTADAFTTTVRAFPELAPLDEPTRLRMRTAAAARADAMRDLVPRRDDEQRARAEVLEWRELAEHERGREPQRED